MLNDCVRSFSKDKIDSCDERFDNIDLLKGVNKRVSVENELSQIAVDGAKVRADA